MRVTAYALLRFNQRTRELLGWGVYSSDEGSITCSNDIHYARLSEAPGEDFAEARGRAIEVVRRWLPGLGEPT